MVQWTRLRTMAVLAMAVAYFTWVYLGRGAKLRVELSEDVQGRSCKLAPGLLLAGSIKWIGFATVAAAEANGELPLAWGAGQEPGDAIRVREVRVGGLYRLTGGPCVLNPVDVAPEVSTNDAAQWSISAIEIMEMCADKLPYDIPQTATPHSRHFPPEEEPYYGLYRAVPK